MKCVCGGEIIDDICNRCSANIFNNRLTFRKEFLNMGKENPKKEDYIECPSCKSFIKKDKVKSGFIFRGKECPVCGEDLSEDEKESDKK